MRTASLDALRGAATLAMAAYHVPYLADARSGFRTEHRADWGWLGTFARTAFLGLSGFVPSSSRPWFRAGRLAAGALIMTAWTRWVFPRHYVRFGVLHFLAAAGLAARHLADPLAQGSPAAYLALGLACRWVFRRVRSAALPGYPAYALGCGAHTHHAMDYFPLLGYLPVVLAGRALAAAGCEPSALPAPEALQWLGRNSLEAYLLHWPAALALSAAFV